MTDEQQKGGKMTVSSAAVASDYSQIMFTRTQTENKSRGDIFGEIFTAKMCLEKEADTYTPTVQASQSKVRVPAGKHPNSIEEVSSEGLSPERKFLGITSYAVGNLTSNVVCAYEALESTAEDPIVQISMMEDGEKKTYNIYINEIDPQNASDIEMFAFFSYHDSIGEKIGDAINSWSAYKLARYESDLDDFADEFADELDRFKNKKINAYAVIQDVYAKMSEINSPEAKKQANIYKELLALLED